MNQSIFDTVSYYVVTEERSYNSVDSLEHLINIRRNWQDYSRTLQVFQWHNDGTGWVEINPEDMIE